MGLKKEGKFSVKDKMKIPERAIETHWKIQKQTKGNSNHGVVRNTKKPSLHEISKSREQALKEMLLQEKKAGVFIDRRIGEGSRSNIGYSHTMTQEERMLARVVRERVSRSKRSLKYQLDDDDSDNVATPRELLTHKGKPLLDKNSAFDDDDVFLSSDDENGQLDKGDTEMHFGGGAFDKKCKAQMNLYGPSDSSTFDKNNLGEVYRSRKQDLDDLIAMKKREKILKVQRKEQQGKYK